ncbi:MAG: enoyl-CoA hydratase-related protein, partial [Chloroflexota bacterium]
FSVYCARFASAAEGTRFGEPFVLRGLPYGGYLLPRHVGLAKATEMLFTGDPIEADEALRLGLINRLVPADQLEATVQEWAARFAKAATLAIGGVKTAINAGMGVGLQEGFQYIEYASLRAGQSEDRAEGVRAFVERREPQFKGR